MLAEMTPAHLTEWRAFYARNPWGDIRADTRAAIQTVNLERIHQGQELDIHGMFPYPRTGDDDETEADALELEPEQIVAMYSRRER